MRNEDETTDGNRRKSNKLYRTKTISTTTSNEWKTKKFKNFNGYHDEDERQEGPRKVGWEVNRITRSMRGKYLIEDQWAHRTRWKLGFRQNLPFRLTGSVTLFVVVQSKTFQYEYFNMLQISQSISLMNLDTMR